MIGTSTLYPLLIMLFNKKCAKYDPWSDLVLVNEGGIEVFNVLT